MSVRSAGRLGTRWVAADGLQYGLHWSGRIPVENLRLRDVDGDGVCEAITYTDRLVDDALFAEVKRHFTEPQIVELTAAIAFENFRSKFNPPLGIEAQGFCMVPKR